MISGLLNNLIGQYNLANAPNPAPAVSDPNNLSGLLQTTGIPLTSNPIGNRTPDYMSLLGMMGQQPFTPGYTPVGGGEATGTPTSDYLNRVLAGLNQTQTGNPFNKNKPFTEYYSGPEYGRAQADIVNMYMNQNNGILPKWATYDYLTGGG